MAKSSTSVKPGQRLNPSGRPAKTEDEKLASGYLRAQTLATAQRLVQLRESSDEKIALGACQTILRITLGDTVRAPVDEDGKTQNPFDGLTVEQLAALAARKVK